MGERDVQSTFLVTDLSEGLEALQDGPVARAAAEVTPQGTLYLLHGGLGVVPQQRVHGHDNARSAETTLGAVGLGQTLLRSQNFTKLRSASCLEPDVEIF